MNEGRTHGYTVFFRSGFIESTKVLGATGDLKARIEKSGEVINHVRRIGGGFSHFNFLESVNIEELVK